jgi:GAF domain-containing protein
MLKDDELIGVIVIYRQEVRPFSEKQIELLQNFAAQAVIAIENTRLLNELRESLQQQTATADVLKVISTSPGELEPVFQAMLENAVRICKAKYGQMFLYDGKDFRAVGTKDLPTTWADFLGHNNIPPHPAVPPGRALITKRVVHVNDARIDEGYVQRHPGMVAVVELGGARTLMVVPMLKENEVVGAITIFRQEVRPFTERQIELVINFAAQAVIAIENTRLLNELRQSLEQQTAHRKFLKSSQARPENWRPYFRPCWRAQRGSARLNSARCTALTARCFTWQPRSARHPTLPNSKNSVGRFNRCQAVTSIASCGQDERVTPQTSLPKLSLNRRQSLAVRDLLSASQCSRTMC